MIASMLFFLLAAILFNLYAFRGLKIIAGKLNNERLYKTIIYSYFVIDALFIIFALVWIIIIRTSQWPDFIKYRNYFYISGAFALIYFPRFAFIPFVLINDVKIFLVFLMRSVLFPGSKIYKRLKIFYNTKVFLSAGVVLSVVVFFVVIHGIAAGKTNFKAKEVDIYFDSLPRSFDGFVIAHISDTHLGSFKDEDNVKRGIEKIISLEPDVVVFTGDLINNQALEGEPYIEAFNNLSSSHGKLSILGNHDIGDYRRWYTIEEKDPDIHSVVNLHKKLGFELLRNGHKFISKNEDSLMIAGVDNWGLPPFEQIGDLSAALEPYCNFDFIVLLSHDPTHWTERVKGTENIQLTLSGHTHGMQIGINIFGFRWSPSKLVYPKWYGLYEYNGQFLYVNPGFGFLGLPLRIGVPPEITMITLRKKD